MQNKHDLSVHHFHRMYLTLNVGNVLFGVLFISGLNRSVTVFEQLILKNAPNFKFYLELPVDPS